MDNHQRTPILGMEQQHREKILSNTEKLVNATNYKSLLLACCKAGLLNRAMVNKIEAVAADSSGGDVVVDEALQRERHRRLFLKLTKRGPTAFQTLKNILESQFPDALKLLNDDNGDENYTSCRQGHLATMATTTASTMPVEIIVKEQQHTRSEGACVSRLEDESSVDGENFVLRPYDKEIKPKVEHEVLKSTQIHNTDQIAAYPMKSRNRGVLFMVNIIDFVKEDDFRKGAKQDSESLLHLFKALGFTLFAFENLRSDEFKKCLDEVIKSEYVRKAECFVMALMTHGEIDDNNRVEIVQLSDGSVIKVDDILSRFNNNACRNLIDKPKIFLFPFCRGQDHDFGHAVSTKRTQADSIGKNSVTRKPLVSDVLICYATLQGFRSYRDTDDGSWYIQAFCRNMARHAHNLHFEDILKNIQSDANQQRNEYGAMQTANYVNLSFNKQLYFNPGVYEELSESI